MNLRGILLAAVACAALVAPASAQEGFFPRARMAVYVEALGPTEYASLNFDWLVAGGSAARGGLQIAGTGSSLGAHYADLPLALSHVWFRGRHGAELGGGLVASIGPGDGWRGLETS